MRSSGVRRGILGAVVLTGVGAGAVRAQEAWRQVVDYQIEATLDEDREVLRGRARLTYENRSPDTLERLYFHQYLNAFRPNSTWARVERREQLDFQHLGDPDHAFERLLRVRSMAAGAGGSDVVGRDMGWSYPNAPDSTVVEVPLLKALEPGDAVTLELDWEARPSTLCRRQCRAGRHYDFAQWYPRIAPYDEDGWAHHMVYPAGEFYGSFGRYDVVLDIEADQVVGATGAVLSGDPGWGVEPSGGDFYESRPGDPPRLGLLSISPFPGRKRLRLYAEDVHHFAWTTSPEYVHESGVVPARPDRPRPIEVHVLYRPGDEDEWGGGKAAASTVSSLRFLEDVFGPYPWPQLTNVHRLEGGGTEFPMMIMDGSANPGLIMHETAHQYAHGIFGNNEWKEAWLDEGFASFLASWAFEADQPAAWRQSRDRMAEMEARGFEQPVSTLSEEFESFGLYNYMAYTRGSFVFRMLHGLIGDEMFRAALVAYYERYRFRHVTEESLRTAVEEVSGQDLGWFFEQWLHTTATLDYGIGEVDQRETPEGWATGVEVIRTGDAWMPVTLRVGDEERVVDGRGRSQRVEVISTNRPDRASLDPDGWILDTDPSNDVVEIAAPASAVRRVARRAGVTSGA